MRWRLGADDVSTVLVSLVLAAGTWIEIGTLRLVNGMEWSVRSELSSDKCGLLKDWDDENTDENNKICFRLKWLFKFVVNDLFPLESSFN